MAVSMAVPFNDLSRRFRKHHAELLALWSGFIEKGIFIGGDAVAHFETKFASFCGGQHCISVGNGTDALELALRGVGVSAGDEVVTVANAGGYTTAACHVIGARPVYVDVDPVNCQLDTTTLLASLSRETRAIVVTHLYGFCNDVQRIRTMLSAVGREDIFIVEDCAQAHGGSFFEQRVGSTGDAAAFSFYPTKNLGALGDAGAIVCREQSVAARIRQLRQYGWDRKYQALLAGGRNSRMDPLQALVLIQQLDFVTDYNVKRRRICARYADCLRPEWRLVGAHENCFVGHLAVLVAPDRAARESAVVVLRQAEIDFDIHYPVLDCDQIAWRDLGRCVGELPTSRDLIHRIISIPCFPELTENEVEHVIGALLQLPFKEQTGTYRVV